MNVNELNELIDAEVATININALQEEVSDTTSIDVTPNECSNVELLNILVSKIANNETKLTSINNRENSNTEFVINYKNSDNETIENSVIVNIYWKQKIIEATELAAKLSGAEVTPNSESLLVREETSRFSGAIWFNKIQEQSVIIAGLGGIGSWTSFLLGRLGIRDIILYDSDTVERGNLSGQLYGNSDIGNSKANASRNNIYEYSGIRVSCFNRYYDESSQIYPIVIGGFDNMDARKVLFHRWRAFVSSLNEEEKKKCLLIDGRLTADQLQVFALEGDNEENIKEYESKWLFEDSEAEHTICSFKQTSFMSNMIASIITNILVNFVANQCDPLFSKTVPFFTSYNSDIMLLKEE